MKLKTLTLAVAALAMHSAAGAVYAHHSYAMFDESAKLTLEGVVTEFQWTNPHSWLQVMVDSEGGEAVEWSLEMGSPGGLARNGWRPRTVVPGDAVTVTLHPLKDGSPGGQLLTVRLPNGELMGE